MKVRQIVETWNVKKQQWVINEKDPSNMILAIEFQKLPETHRNLKNRIRYEEVK